MLPSNLGEEFIIKLYVTKNDFEQKEFLGLCKVEWKQCIANPNEWAVKVSSDLIDPDQDSAKLPKDGKI